jgi:hypothetical protein
MLGGYVVRDATGQALAYIYSRDDEAETRQSKVLTNDEARRIAINIARLPELLGKLIAIEPSAPPTATSCLGAFRTPAAPAGGSAFTPASENLVWGLGSQAENSRHAFFLQPNFFVRLESPFLRPDPHRPSAVARRGCQGWPSLRYLLMHLRCQAIP